MAFNCSGLVDVVENHETGYLAKPFESDDLSNGIEWVFNMKTIITSQLNQKKSSETWNQK